MYPAEAAARLSRSFALSLPTNRDRGQRGLLGSVNQRRTSGVGTLNRISY
jgi:hypothetical protein